MIWPDDDRDALLEQQKKREYARELDRQIELRREKQRQEQRELEEFERKFQPDERSPAKWLIEGGHYVPPMRSFPSTNSASASIAAAAAASPWRREAPSLSPSRQQSHQHETHDDTQDHGVSTGEQTTGYGGDIYSGANMNHTADGLSNPNSFSRFRLIDQDSTTDRLRERVQQMEWKRLLDEQVRENARIKQQVEEEQRMVGLVAAQEEMRYAREQQLRAQRKLGYPTYAAGTPNGSNQHVSLPSPPQTQQHQYTASAVYDKPERSDFRQSVLNIPQENTNYPGDYSYRNLYDATTTRLPPPAPSQLNHTNNRMDNDTAFTKNNLESPSYQESHRHMLQEYWSLLEEIRREREELRREREDIRKEKEELRLERTMLQLESEKMAHLVESQRKLQEQNMETLHRDQAERLQMSPSRQYPDYASPRSVLRSGNITPQNFGYSQVSQLERSMASMGLGGNGASSVRRTPLSTRRPNPVVIDDFDVPKNRWRLQLSESPRYQPLQQYRPRPYADEGNQRLDESLVGESVFVAVEPSPTTNGKHVSARGTPHPTETSSPIARDRDTSTSQSNNPLRDSRVIKSRGFYDIERELRSPAARSVRNRQPLLDVDTQSPSRTTARGSSEKRETVMNPFQVYETSSSGSLSPVKQRYDHPELDLSNNELSPSDDSFEEEDDADNDDSDNNGDMDDSEDDEQQQQKRASAVSTKSLFQVKVLV